MRPCASAFCFLPLSLCLFMKTAHLCMCVCLRFVECAFVSVYVTPHVQLCALAVSPPSSVNPPLQQHPGGLHYVRKTLLQNRGREAERHYCRTEAGSPDNSGSLSFNTTHLGLHNARTVKPVAGVWSGSWWGLRISDVCGQACRRIQEIPINHVLHNN